MANRVPVKWQLLGFGWLLAFLLAFYTLGALWEYAETLDSRNGWMLKVGFTACEASIFVWIWWHVFRRWIVTRVWCLVAATAMGIFLVVHAAAVTKYTSSKKEASSQVLTLAGGLAQITGAGAKGIVEGAGTIASGQRHDGAPNTARSTVATGVRAASETTVKNGQVLAEATLQAETQARNSTFLSPEYLNGKMFAVVFIALLGLAFLTFVVFEAGKAEEDDDQDGTPNFADIDSPYYDAKRAGKWWGDRGQSAPHQNHQYPKQSPAMSPSVAKSPPNTNTTFISGGNPPKVF